MVVIVVEGNDWKWWITVMIVDYGVWRTPIYVDDGGNCDGW